MERMDCRAIFREGIAMTDHPRLLDALKLVESGAVKASLSPSGLTKLHGCGKLGPAIWSADSREPLVQVSARRGERVTVTLTESGKRRLEEER